MDLLQFKYSNSIFSRLNPKFWNPERSWRNKYKNLDPKEGSRFFGSTTFLVFLTDGWHLAQSAFLFCILCAAPVYTPMLGIFWDVLLFNLSFRIVFELCFRLLQQNN